LECPAYRFALYNTFMLVPAGMPRVLAHKPLALDDEDEDEVMVKHNDAILQTAPLQQTLHVTFTEHCVVAQWQAITCTASEQTMLALLKLQVEVEAGGGILPSASNPEPGESGYKGDTGDRKRDGGGSNSTKVRNR
jgi:hypothetical protein